MSCVDRLTLQKSTGFMDFVSISTNLMEKSYWKKWLKIILKLKILIFRFVFVRKINEDIIDDNIDSFYRTINELK